MAEVAEKTTVTVKDIDAIFTHGPGLQFTIRAGDSYEANAHGLHVILQDGREFAIPYNNLFYFQTSLREEDPTKQSADISQKLRDQFNGVKPSVIQ